MKILLVLLALLLVAALVVKFTPWYVSVGLAVLWALAVKFLAKPLFMRLLTAPFRMKGRVLRGADAGVNGLEPAEMPTLKWGDTGGEECASGDAEDHEEIGAYKRHQIDDYRSRTWFALDVNITPKAGGGEFTHWEPGEIRLVPPDTDVRRALADHADGDDGEGPCVVHEAKIHVNGAFVQDEEGKYEGPRRLQMLIGVNPGTARLKFQYYFEDFGEVVLPTA